MEDILRLEDRVNMEQLRSNIQMFSINQMNCYHVLLEAFNVIRNGSSERIREKWLPNKSNIYSNNVIVPQVNHVKCQGFSWYAAKMWNELPEEIKAIVGPSLFKDKIKEYIWEKIPSY